MGRFAAHCQITCLILASFVIIKLIVFHLILIRLIVFIIFKRIVLVIFHHIILDLIMILVIYVELSQRRIPVQYTRRMIGRKMYGGSSTYLPLKINMSGVIPPIFASSILAVPTLIAQFGNSDQSWVCLLYTSDAADEL